MSDSCVYVSDKNYGWLPANVLNIDGNKEALVKVWDVDMTRVLEEGRKVKLKDYENEALPLQNVDASGNLMVLADMVDLPSLHEAAILYNLRSRHMIKKPYTRVGDLIIAVNPFQWLKELYSLENRTRYVEQLIHNTQAAEARALLPPHVYETSSLAYRGLALEGHHQSILVSGESGAGKTETVKIVMNHLASIVSTSITSATDDEEDTAPQHHLVVQRVLDSHPLLEAFGNAKTVRNDNSSRFGKFIQMQFDVEDVHQAQMQGRAVPHCFLAGSTCETYLLEKSRVVSHEQGEERSYHVFYQLLATSDTNKKEHGCEFLVGKSPEDFTFFTSGGNPATTNILIEGKTDAERFDITVKALKLLEIDGPKLSTLFRAVAVVMQLGNLIVQADPSDSEKSMIVTENNTSLQELMNIMGIPSSEEARLIKSFTYRTVVAGRGETFTSPLRPELAHDAIHAFAKEIYQQVFDWLVRSINSITCAEANYEDAKDVDEYGLVGLLDIFGFESFVVNRFEQLCINYTNEKLQQKYTIDIFRSVQEEYAHEGIELGEISFQDNAEVLRLLEGKIGILSVLNEECVRPKGNDVAFVSKVKSVNKDSIQLVSKKLDKPTEFGIDHYAGKVTYDATNFVQKNTDALPKDLIDAACLSSNDLIRVELKAAADAKLSGSKTTSRRQLMTVATKFKAQLTQLMKDIAKTKTRYIRCIKPNPEKEPLKMNMFSSAEQLRCAGVVAAVTISRVAFPNRLMHETALERFSCLSHVDLSKVAEEKKEASENDETGYRDAVHGLLTTLLEPRAAKKEDGTVQLAFECGKSRVYFRTGALEYLEAERLNALGVFAMQMERMARGFTARSKFWKLKNAAIESQANARRVIARRNYVYAKTCFISVQCWVRCIYAKRELVRLRREKASISIQSRWRSFVEVVMLAKCLDASIVMQKTIRGALQRPKYKQALKEAEEEARVNSKLAALQKRLKDAEMRAIQADKARLAAEKRAAMGGAAAPAAAAAATAAPSAVATDGGEVEEEKKSGVEPSSSPQSKELIDESNEMLEYFRKEVFKLKSTNYLLRNDMGSLRQEHQHLAAHCASLEASNSAMKQNLQKLSTNNMRLAHEASNMKDTVTELRQELKMSNVKSASELRRKEEELLGRDKAHDAEVARLKRELERLRKLMARSGPSSSSSSPPSRSLVSARREAFSGGGGRGGGGGKYTRAHFRDQAKPANPILGGRNKEAGTHPTTSLEGAAAAGGDRASSPVDGIDDEKWGHDSYFKRMEARSQGGGGGRGFGGGRSSFRSPRSGRYRSDSRRNNNIPPPPPSLSSYNKDSNSSSSNITNSPNPTRSDNRNKGGDKSSSSLSESRNRGDKSSTSLAAAAASRPSLAGRQSSSSTQNVKNRPGSSRNNASSSLGRAAGGGPNSGGKSRSSLSVMASKGKDQGKGGKDQQGKRK